jgi:inhibitor of KinA sporulation pathway (predicted exonuclease)
MAGALKHTHLPLEGTHHRGADDARNIAQLVAWLVREHGVEEVLHI